MIIFLVQVGILAAVYCLECDRAASTITVNRSSDLWSGKDISLVNCLPLY